MSEEIDYVDYSKVFHVNDDIELLEVRRNGIIYVADRGELELDGREDSATEEANVFFGWSNAGPRFQDIIEKEPEMEFWVEESESGLERDNPGYRLWEHIKGEEAEVRFQYWLSKIPADITIDLEELENE